MSICMHVACNKDGADSSLVNYQTHSHAKTYMKKQPIRRFNFPIPPMLYTIILSPLDDGDETFAAASVTFNDICAYLSSDAFKGSDLTFEQYLTVLKQDRVFLKRSPKDSRVNAYNPILLESWQANLDIQFVLDPYACATYIVSYISNGQWGMSNLLRHAREEAQFDIRQQVRKIGNKFFKVYNLYKHFTTRGTRRIIEAKTCFGRYEI